MQDRALIFTGGEQVLRQNYQPLLAGSCLIAADSGYLYHEDEISFDYAIGDFDSCPQATANKIIKHPASKDYSDTELAIRLALELGFNEIIMIGGSGGRLDHWQANLKLIFKYPIARWFTKNEEIVIITDRLELVSRQVVSFVGNNETKIGECSGLKWNIKGVCWANEVSLANETASGAVVTLLAGKLLAVYPYLATPLKH